MLRYCTRFLVYWFFSRPLYAHPVANPSSPAATTYLFECDPQLRGCASETYVPERIFPYAQTVPFNGKNIYKRRTFSPPPPIVPAVPRSQSYDFTSLLYARRGRCALTMHRSPSRRCIKSSRCMKFTPAPGPQTCNFVALKYALRRAKQAAGKPLRDHGQPGRVDARGWWHRDPRCPIGSCSSPITVTEASPNCYKLPSYSFLFCLKGGSVKEPSS